MHINLSKRYYGTTVGASIEENTSSHVDSPLIYISRYTFMPSWSRLLDIFYLICPGRICFSRSLMDCCYNIRTQRWIFGCVVATSIEEAAIFTTLFLQYSRAEHSTHNFFCSGSMLFWTNISSYDTSVASSCVSCSRALLILLIGI